MATKTELPLEVGLRHPGLRLREFALRQLETAERALEADAAELPRGVHQARKALRRTRAAIGLAGSCLPQHGKQLHEQIKRVSNSWSELRDADALWLLLEVRSNKHRAIDAGFEAFSAWLETRRSELLAETLLGDPGQSRSRERLREIQAEVLHLPWQAVELPVISKALARSLRRVRRAKKGASKLGSMDARHRWRRRLRQAVYQLELLEEIARHSQALPTDRPRRKKMQRRANKLGKVRDLELLALAMSSREEKSIDSCR